MSALRYIAGETYGIPYRALIPKGLRNVLVAGRCISADRYMQSTVRVMPCCMLTDATTLTDEAGDVRKVDYALLRRTLMENGVYIK